MSNLVRTSGDKYYLEPNTEITKEQYDAINNSTEQPVSGTLSEAAILRLHQESDPASPLYKGPEPVDGGHSELASGESESTSLYNEPTQSELEEAAKDQPEPTGTTTFTTEEVTIPAVIEETPTPEVDTIPESATPNGNQGSTDTPPVEVEPKVAEPAVKAEEPTKKKK